MAGGMGLLCMTDMAVAADHVQFGLPEVKVGVFPMQVMSLLQQIAPRRRVREWALGGEPFDAAQALQAGLVNHVVPAAELDAKVDWLVGRIVDKSPTAIRRGKYAMRAIEAMTFDQAIATTESQIALLAMTDDAKEGAGVVQREAQAAVDRALKQRRCRRSDAAGSSWFDLHSRAASDAGTATGMSSSICAMPLPSGSKRAEAGPPPASASCSMQVHRVDARQAESARPGPSPGARSGACTASGVTRCHSSGSHSGRRAMSPMLEMSPLSPLRPKPA